MIRVNLLSGNTRPVRKREWVRPEQRPAAVGLLLLVVTAASLAGWWWMLRADRTKVDLKIATEEADLTRLKAAAALVDRASARRTELQERLALISRLRASEHDPVELLEAVSASVPDGLWLLELKQQSDSIEITGRALTITSITDFVDHLQSSNRFVQPIAIVSTNAETVEDAAVVKFDIKAQTLPRTLAAHAGEGHP